MSHNGLEGPHKQPRAQGVSPESLCLVLYQPRGNPNTLTGGLQEDKGGSVCSSQAAAAVDRGFAVISCSFVGHCGPGRDDDALTRVLILTRLFCGPRPSTLHTAGRCGVTIALLLIFCCNNIAA
jgi:hypothetical protein